jgi:hypothetical protein
MTQASWALREMSVALSPLNPTARGVQWEVVLIAHGPAMVPFIIEIVLADTTLPFQKRAPLRVMRSMILIVRECHS